MNDVMADAFPIPAVHFEPERGWVAATSRRVSDWRDALILLHAPPSGVAAAASSPFKKSSFLLNISPPYASK